MITNIIFRRSDSPITSDKPHYENEPFNIPKSWIMAQMSDLFLLNPKSEINDNTEIGFIPMACVDDGFSGKHSFEIRNWGDVKKGYCHFQDGDIGVAKISPCFENLKSCILQSLPNGVGTGTTELVILRSLGVYAPFYLYLFKSSWYISQGTKYFKGVVGQQRVNKAIFTELEVPLPSVAEQERIVAEIKRWFGLIDLIEKDKFNLANNIKLAKSKILDLAIHGKLVPQDPTEEPASELLKRINPKAEITCDNGHYQKLPKAWCLTKVKDVFIINPKNKVNDDIETGFVPMTNISDGFSNNFTFETRKWATIKSGFTHFANGDIAVAKISPCLENRKSMVLSNLPNGVGAGTTELFVFRPLCVIQQYGLYFFKTYFFINQCIGTFNGVVGQQRVGKNIVEEISFPLPPIKEQHRIVAKIGEIFAQLDAIEASL